jgi:hypothetical protein
MARISNCPNCTQPVTIPDGLDPASQVRCPTCEAEYPLEEALAEATEPEPVDGTMAFLKSLQEDSAGHDVAEAPPPELIFVTDVVDEEAEEESEGVAEEEGQLGELAEAAEPEAPADNTMAFLKSLQETADAGDAASPAEEDAPEAEEGAEEDSAEAGGQNVESADAEEPGEAAIEVPVEETSEGLEFAAEETEESADDAAVESEPDLVEANADAVAEPGGAPGEASEGELAETAEAAAESESAGLGQLAADGEGAAAVETAAEQTPVEPEPVYVDYDPMVRSPHGDGEFHLSELLVAGTGQPLGAATASLIVHYGLARPRTEEELAEIEAESEEDSGQATAAEGGFTGFAIRDEAAAAEQSEGAARPARPRPKRKPKSAVREFVGIVLGGIAGLAIAYYALMIIKGPEQGNMFKLPVPGYPSTYRYAKKLVPDWWPEWAKFGAASSANGSEEEGDSAEDPDPNAEGKAPGQKPPTGRPRPGNGSTKPAGKPAAKPGETKPAPAKMVAVRNAPTFASEDLGHALKAANAAFGCEACNSTGKVTKTVVVKEQVGGQTKEIQKQQSAVCEVCKGLPSREMKEAAFDKFCYLAKVLTFVQGPDNQAQLGDRKRAAQGLVEQAAQSEAGLAKIGELADERLADESRLEAGILLAGTVQSSAPEGPAHATEIVLAKSGKSVTLISRQSLPVAQNDRVAVLGTIVDEPREYLAGYQGAKPMVVFVGACVKLP